MKKFEFLEHTADTKIRAYGKNLEEQFSNAALALTSVMIEPKLIKKEIKKEIKVNGTDQKSLLYNFLEQFLILLDSEFFVINKVEKIEIKGLTLKATLIGDKLSEKYETSGDVKAITYNDMEIQKEYVQFVLDL